MKDPFHQFATYASKLVGKSGTFIAAALLVVGWALMGPIFHFSNTWQIVINTLTTIITFLMVFLIQHTQNRDSDAIQIKLDELVRIHRAAHNSLIDLDNLS